MFNKAIFFGNIYINDHENYLRMIDSFNSFDFNNFDEIIVNIRGYFKDKASKFLIKKKNVQVFQINSDFGWFHDSYKLLSNTSGNYIFIWVEDFICFDQEGFNKYLINTQENNIDVARYSYKKYFETSFPNSKIFNDNLISFSLNLSENDFKLTDIFIIPYCSIIKKELFLSILLNNFNSLWSKFTPFGFEQNSKQTHWLPLRMSFLKKEVLISIDDDHDIPQSSLQSRGLYPIRTISRKNSKHLFNYLMEGKKYKIKKIFNLSITLIKLFKFLFLIKIPIKVLIRILKYINIITINIEFLNLMKYISCSNEKNITIFTLDNKLNNLNIIFAEKNIKIISNVIFQIHHDNEIILNPLEYNQLIKKESNITFNGFSIILNILPNTLKSKNIIIHRSIYLSMTKKQKKTLNNKNIFYFN